MEAEAKFDPSMLSGLEFKKGGDVESYRYTTREYQNSKYVDGVAGSMILSTPETYTVTINRKNGTLTFEHA